MIPKYLYHYTTVETLKKILASSNIRFTRLDLLNDPYEGLIFMDNIPRNKEFFRKLIYCACFTEQAIESVNLWAVYTDMRGVRIKLKSNMFVENLSLMEHKDSFVPYGNLDDKLTRKIQIGKESFDLTISRIFGPIKISYVHTLEETTGIVIDGAIKSPEVENDSFMRAYDLRELGLRKINYWNFEDEWRYKLQFAEAVNEKNDLINYDYYVKSPEYIDIPLHSHISEITLGPRITEEDCIDLKLFLKNNKFDIPVVESKIKIGKWR